MSSTTVATSTATAPATPVAPEHATAKGKTNFDKAMLFASDVKEAEGTTSTVVFAIGDKDFALITKKPEFMCAITTAEIAAFDAKKTIIYKPTAASPFFVDSASIESAVGKTMHQSIIVSLSDKKCTIRSLKESRDDATVVVELIAPGLAEAMAETGTKIVVTDVNDAMVILDLIPDEEAAPAKKALEVAAADPEFVKKVAESKMTVAQTIHCAMVYSDLRGMVSQFESRVEATSAQIAQTLSSEGKEEFVCAQLSDGMIIQRTKGGDASKTSALLSHTYQLFLNHHMAAEEYNFATITVTGASKIGDEEASTTVMYNVKFHFPKTPIHHNVLRMYASGSIKSASSFVCNLLINAVYMLLFPGQMAEVKPWGKAIDTIMDVGEKYGALPNGALDSTLIWKDANVIDAVRSVTQAGIDINNLSHVIMAGGNEILSLINTSDKEKKLLTFESAPKYIYDKFGREMKSQSILTRDRFISEAREFSTDLPTRLLDISDAESITSRYFDNIVSCVVKNGCRETFALTGKFCALHSHNMSGMSNTLRKKIVKSLCEDTAVLCDWGDKCAYIDARTGNDQCIRLHIDEKNGRISHPDPTSSYMTMKRLLALWGFSGDHDIVQTVRTKRSIPREPWAKIGVFGSVDVSEWRSAIRPRTIQWHVPRQPPTK